MVRKGGARRLHYRYETSGGGQNRELMASERYEWKGEAASRGWSSERNWLRAYISPSHASRVLNSIGGEFVARISHFSRGTATAWKKTTCPMYGPGTYQV